MVSTIPAPGNAALFDAALDCVRRGWSIIPTIGKKAADPWKKRQTQSADKAALEHMFRRRGITGIAVVLGSASGGLACRDYDDPDAYLRWQRFRPDLAATLPIVETKRGVHIYFRGPEGFKDFGDGEYRADNGHYCLLPPSVHPDGLTYRWLNPLPVGELPVIDPEQAGLLVCNTAYTANSAHTLTPSLLVLQAIESTQPTTSGERNRRLFHLARALKALPDYASAAVSALRPIVVEWHRRALPVIGTKEFSESWSDFITAWNAVQFPAGSGTVDAAFKRAVASKPPRKAVALYAGEPAVLLLASLCRELQRVAGDAPFFLDCRTAGQLVGVHHVTAWRLLTVVLPADGILAVGERGEWGSKATGKANEYHYLGD